MAKAAGNEFDPKTMPSAPAARKRERSQFYGVWLYSFIAGAVSLAILGIVAFA